MFTRRIKPRLLEVQRPARYIGGEPGAMVRDWDTADFRFCLAFPDLYEIGMSYYGREVIYQLLNRQPGVLCERTFLPAPDMQALMAEEEVPLWALESKRPVRDFDALGISLTYELAYPSALKLIQLAGLPLIAAERRAGDPLVIAGGQCMCNPEPVAPYFDIIVNGEAEEVLLELLTVLRSTTGQPRDERLLAAAQVRGCYVPRFYAASYDERGMQCGVKRLRDDVPERIAYRYVADFTAQPLPVDPVVPLISVPSDKAYLEVLRGCPQGCRFCQAGYITRPARARPVAQLAQAAVELARNTGTDEVGLMSLSTLDHPQVAELVAAVKESLPEYVGVALPSLRADRMSAQLAEILRRPRETSLTIALESGSASLRQAINKRVSDADILDTFRHLMQAGWHKFKLYFMCGFAGETLADMEAIPELVRRILALARELKLRRPVLRLSLAVLVPKPHTPLQWQAMEAVADTAAKIRTVRSGLKPLGGGIKLSWHEPGQSVIEALLSRGGRELAPLMQAAMAAGQVLPSDHFDYAVWERLLAETGIDLQAQVFEPRDVDAGLPWDHISRGVDKRFLAREWAAFNRGEPSAPCHEECTACGIGCGCPVFTG